MKLSLSGIAFLKAKEGFKPTVYKCSSGFETVGYGHKLLPGEAFQKPLNEAEATLLLMQDVKQFERNVNKRVKVKLEQHEFDALVSFSFNLGNAAFDSSTLLKLLNQGERELAAEEFPKWKFGRDKNGQKVVVQGLLNRRLAERELFLKK